MLPNGLRFTIENAFLLFSKVIEYYLNNIGIVKLRIINKLAVTRGSNRFNFGFLQILREPSVNLG